MQEVIRLVRVDFDNMENRDALSEEEVGIFSGYASLEAWSKKQPKVALYVGWDKKVYPQFRTEIKFVRGG